jgi:hypothetical protein
VLNSSFAEERNAFFVCHNSYKAIIFNSLVCALSGSSALRTLDYEVTRGI